jgi:hypothetical protein
MKLKLMSRAGCLGCPVGIKKRASRAFEGSLHEWRGLLGKEIILCIAPVHFFT